MLPSLMRLEVIWKFPTSFPSTELVLAPLTHVTLSMPGYMGLLPDFSGMTSLKEVDIDFDRDLSDFLLSASNLTRLVLRGVLANPSGLESFTALESLEFRGPSEPSGLYGSILVLPPNLLDLTISSWASTYLEIVLNSPTLEQFTLKDSPRLNTIQRLPSSIKTILFENVPSVSAWPLNSVCNFEKFTWIDSADSGLPASLLSDCTALKELNLFSVSSGTLNGLITGPPIPNNIPLTSLSIIGPPDWPSSDWIYHAHLFLCSLPSSLRYLALSNTNFISFPSCVTQFSSLKTLDLGNVIFPLERYYLANFSSSITQLNVDPSAIGISHTSDETGWAKLVEHMPNLTILNISSSSPLNQPFPASHLGKLTLLESLGMTNMKLSGSLPSNFFKSMISLKTLDLSSNALSGTIPTEGWPSLEKMVLNNNDFSDWPSVKSPGAPRLNFIDLSYNLLQSLPNDETFMKMSSLRYLQLGRLSNMKGKLPTFWAKGEHKLETLISTMSSFSGSLPSTIWSPYIRHLDLGFNELCGGLPEIGGAMGVKQIILPFNHFSGSIPSSWGTNLLISIELNLQSNLIEGTIPNPLLMEESQDILEKLILKDIYLTGPLLNFSQYKSLQSLHISGNDMTMDWCRMDPEWPEVIISSPGSCFLTLDPSLCNCPQFYQGCTDLSSFCSIPASNIPDFDGISPKIPIIPPSFPCGLPPDCPLPSPGPSFRCIGSTWISSNSVTQPSLTVPGSKIIIQGNLTLTDGITFNGINSEVLVNGCIFLGNGNEVVIELTKEELKQLEKEGKVSKTLLSVNGQCSGSSDLSGTVISATKPGDAKKCQKLKVENSNSSPSTLIATFTVDSSSCNTKWIILGSVLGSVIVLAAIGAALLVTFNPKVKSMVKPFSNRNPA